jgi:penicillin-binding protein 1A
VSPLELARAYTVFSTPGEVLKPRPVERISRPGGRVLEKMRVKRKKVVRPSTAYLIRDLMRQAVESGTARAAKIEGLAAAGKTGTSSGRRDAWFAGQAGSLVAAAWVGLDDGKPLGLTGSMAAAPLWRGFMERAAWARPPEEVSVPADVIERRVDPRTGLLVRGGSKGYAELFRRGALPPRDRWLRHDAPVTVVR